MTEQMSANPEDVDRRKFLTGHHRRCRRRCGCRGRRPDRRIPRLPRCQTGQRRKVDHPRPHQQPDARRPDRISLLPFDQGWLGRVYPVRRRLCADVRRAERPGPLRRVHASELSRDLAGRTGNEYVCPCHDGFFDIDGKVVSGPPPKPLNPYQSKIENGQIMILLEA